MKVTGIGLGLCLGLALIMTSLPPRQFTQGVGAAGNLKWHTFLGGTGYDNGSAIAVTPDGGMLITGYSTNTWGNPIHSFQGNRDVFVTRLDAAGVLKWHTFLGGSDADGASAIVVMPDGGALVAGSSDATWGNPIHTFQGSQGDRNAFIAKLDSNGILVWNTFFGGRGPDAAYAIALTANNEALVSGYSHGPWGAPLHDFQGEWYDDGFVLQLDAQGNLKWHTFLGGPSGDDAHAIVLAHDGGAVVAGYSQAAWGSPLHGFEGGQSDAFVARLAANGSLKWHTFLGGTDSDVAKSITLTPDGGILVAGRSHNSWGNPVRPLK